MRRPLMLAIFKLQVATVFCVGMGSLVRAQPIDNPDLFALASQVAEEVELVREFMGRPFDDSPRIPASNVSQPAVYFQAQTLFRKVNQLAQTFAGTPRVAAPALPEGDVEPAHTHRVLTEAMEQVGLVKRALGIETQVEAVSSGSASATGVFMTIIDLNRQLNLLIDEPIGPSDVFDQMTLAVLYGAGILAKYGIEDLPPPAEFDGHKRPADVYGLLLEEINRVSRLSDRAGVDVLRLSPTRNIPDDIEPGHVYDVARILVAGLAVLADGLDAQDVYPALEQPERIFPTQVYARATVLQRQLQQLEPLL